MDKLAAMDTFVCIVEEGSLTGAAKRLSKALPTVVRSLALLEELRTHPPAKRLEALIDRLGPSEGTLHDDMTMLLAEPSKGLRG